MVKCDNSRLASVLGGEQSVADDFAKLDFWLLFLIYALIWCGMALTYSLSDTVCFDILGNEYVNSKTIIYAGLRYTKECWVWYWGLHYYLNRSHNDVCYVCILLFLIRLCMMKNFHAYRKFERAFFVKNVSASFYQLVLYHDLIVFDKPLKQYLFIVNTKIIVLL